MKVNLPARIEVDDYHEFPFLQNQFRKVIPGIKVCEVACTGKYQGVAYLGRKDDPKVKKLIDEIKKEEKNLEESYCPYC